MDRPQTCYTCGQPGHYKANCPHLSPPTTTAEPPSSSTGLPASHITVGELRASQIPAEVAAERAERYASQVRAAMGWGREARETKLRALAEAQLQESRATRDRSTLGTV